MGFNIAVILINIILIAVIYIILRRRVDRLTDTGKISSELAGELDIILAEINQATERNVVIIEDKIALLEEIIRKAEQRIKLLEKTADKPAAVKESQPKTPVLKTEDDAHSAPVQQQLIPDDEPEDIHEAGELTYSHLNRISMMSGMVTPLKTPEKPADTEQDIKQQVVELYKSGIDVSIIAANLGINRGEAELIISLYRQTNNETG